MLLQASFTYKCNTCYGNPCFPEKTLTSPASCLLTLTNYASSKVEKLQITASSVYERDVHPNKLAIEFVKR